jgi:hypothetical protein
MYQLNLLRYTISLSHPSTHPSQSSFIIPLPLKDADIRMQPFVNNNALNNKVPKLGLDNKRHFVYQEASVQASLSFVPLDPLFSFTSLARGLQDWYQKGDLRRRS